MSHVSRTNETHHPYRVAKTHTSPIQGGEDPQDALTYRSFTAKEPLIAGLFCGKWHVKIRHPMTIRHTVPRQLVCPFDSSYSRRGDVMSHIWMSHVTHTNESHHGNVSATAQVWMSHVTHVSESYFAYKWDTSHILRQAVGPFESSYSRMGAFTHMNKSRHTYEWVTS